MLVLTVADGDQRTDQKDPSDPCEGTSGAATIFAEIDVAGHDVERRGAHRQRGQISEAVSDADFDVDHLAVVGVDRGRPRRCCAVEL